MASRAGFSFPSAHLLRPQKDFAVVVRRVLVRVVSDLVPQAGVEILTCASRSGAALLSYFCGVK